MSWKGEEGEPGVAGRSGDDLATLNDLEAWRQYFQGVEERILEFLRSLQEQIDLHKHGNQHPYTPSVDAVSTIPIPEGHTLVFDGKFFHTVKADEKGWEQAQPQQPRGIDAGEQ